MVINPSVELGLCRIHPKGHYEMSETPENEIRDAALRQLSMSRTGFLSTTQLIELLETEFQPTGHDAEILNGRSDTYFSQKVRNLVSHRDQNTGLEARGLAIYDDIREGWTITDRGRATANNPAR